MKNAENLSLTPDQHAVALRELKSAVQALSFVYELVERGTAPVASLQTSLSVAEYKLANFTSATGVLTQSAADVEERHQKLREANLRVRELERLLGAGITPAQIKAGICGLRDRLEGWWRFEGFGHISELSFGPYGCKVELSCMLFGCAPSMFSKAPVSEQEAHDLWLKSLAGRGFVLMEEGRRNLVLEDCAATRQVLCDILKTRFPGCAISETKNHGLRDGKFELKSITLYIYDLGQVAALPEAPAEE